MRPLFETVHDLAADRETVRARRYGVIEVVDGEFRQLRLRPFPRRVLLWESKLLGEWLHRHRPGDRCLLFYNQPRRFPQFLSLVYTVSSRETTFRTARRAATVLDEIAQIKGSDAILCDASNSRISDRLLARWGWVPHAPMPWRRNFIKRLYEQPHLAEQERLLASLALVP